MNPYVVERTRALPRDIIDYLDERPRRKVKRELDKYRFLDTKKFDERMAQMRADCALADIDEGRVSQLVAQLYRNETPLRTMSGVARIGAGIGTIVLGGAATAYIAEELGAGAGGQNIAGVIGMIGTFLAGLVGTALKCHNDREADRIHRYADLVRSGQEFSYGFIDKL